MTQTDIPVISAGIINSDELASTVRELPTAPATP